MQQTNWIVITGGPSSGKSTLIEHFKSNGYSVVPESARILIDKEIAKGKTLQEIRSDEKEFQRKILQMKMKLEEQLSPQQLTFFDRGIPDSVAYYQICGGDRGDMDSVLQACQKRRYKKVFLLEQVPFQNDYAQTEDQKRAQTISKLLYEAYTDLGYDVIKVPLFPIKERAEIILSCIGR